MALVDVEQFDHVAFTVSDLAKSRQWYEQVLGLERRYAEAWPDFPVVLCAGEACVALFPSSAERTPQPNSGLRHLAFRTSRAAFDLAREALAAREIAFHIEDHGICHSLYLADPDGYQVEVTTYEVGSVARPAS